MREKMGVVLLAIVFLFLSLVAQVKEMKPVEPVNWRELMPFLIDIPQYQSEEKPEGSSVSMANFKVSQVSRDYTSGEKTLRIEIIDGGYVQMAYAGFQMLQSFEVDSSEELIKKVDIKGFPGVEKYTYESKEASLTILVADRFLVQMEGQNFENTEELKKIANLLDLGKLSSLAK